MKSLNRHHLLLSLLLALAILLAACGGQGTTGAQAPQVTVVIQQMVTQIVATSPPTNPPPPVQPTPSPQPTATYPSQWNPFSIPIYYPLIGCIASRLHEGDTAIVATTGGSLGLYQSRDLPYAPLIRKLNVGEIWYILRGPHCVQDMLLWEVINLEKETGFIPEGNGEVYWLLPAPPWLQITQKQIRDLLRNP